MGATKPLSNTRAVWHILTPSIVTLAGCIMAAAMIIFIHILLITLHAGTIFANVGNGDVSVAYTNYVVSPLLHVFNLTGFGTAVNAVIWGLIGWFLVVFWHFVARNYYEWRRSEKDIQINRQNTVIYHPLRENFWQRTVWRGAVLFVFIVLILVSRPVINHLFWINAQVVAGLEPGLLIRYILQALATWTLLIYAVVVLLRLYLFRTRIFGEILY